jgi:hypothetical protein
MTSLGPVSLENVVFDWSPIDPRLWIELGLCVQCLAKIDIEGKSGISRIAECSHDWSRFYATLPGSEAVREESNQTPIEYDRCSPVTSEVVGWIPGQTHSSCDRRRLSDSVGFLRCSFFLLHYVTNRPILSIELIKCPSWRSALNSIFFKAHVTSTNRTQCKQKTHGLKVRGSHRNLVAWHAGIAWCFGLEIPTMTKYGQKRQPGATSLQTRIINDWSHGETRMNQFRFIEVNLK